RGGQGSGTAGPGPYAARVQQRLQPGRGQGDSERDGGAERGRADGGLRARPGPGPGRGAGRRPVRPRTRLGRLGCWPGRAGSVAGRYSLRAYIRMASGKVTSTIPAAQASVYQTCEPTGPPTVSARTESARSVTGLTLTQACSQPGMVEVLASSTLLPNTSGMGQMNEMPCTVSGRGATKPTSTETQQTAR